MSRPKLEGKRRRVNLEFLEEEVANLKKLQELMRERTITDTIFKAILIAH